jgi:hypothetical protein
LELRWTFGEERETKRLATKERERQQRQDFNNLGHALKKANERLAARDVFFVALLLCCFAKLKNSFLKEKNQNKKIDIFP